MKPYSWLYAGLLILALGLTGCAGLSPAPAANDPADTGPAEETTLAAPPPRMTHCGSSSVQLDARFDGGQIGQCTTHTDGSFTLHIHPEDLPPINNSPWYAFRASGAPGTLLDIELRFEHGAPRYWPKLSLDGGQWTRAPADAVRFDQEAGTLSLELAMPATTLWVSAQELLTTRWFDEWNRALGTLPFTRTELAGTSAQGRAIMRTESAAQREFVLFVGRQHPPEITGSLTMQSFVDTVFSDSELARRFRERFQVVVYPVLNPDGADLGYWRHTTGGVDLNRDWGPFTQAESRLVRDDVDRRIDAGQRLRLMLDFHSTGRNLFYTQLDSDPTDPPRFATDWLDAARARLPDYAFEQDPRAVNDRPTTKNYFFTRFGVPSITVETGDETDRAALDDAARVFAEEMMKRMLALPPLNP